MQRVALCLKHGAIFFIKRSWNCKNFLVEIAYQKGMFYDKIYKPNGEMEKYMLSNQIIQNSIDELKEISKVNFFVYDETGDCVAMTDTTPELDREIIMNFAESMADSQIVSDYHFLKIKDETETVLVLIAKGSGEEVYMVGKMAVCQLQNLLIAYKERYDRSNFFQNLLLDNLLLVDIHNRASKLHLEAEKRRIVYLVEIKGDYDNVAMEMLKSIFYSQAGDYITSIDERSIVLIKELEELSSKDDIEKVAKTIVDMLNSEAMLKVRVAYGKAVEELKDLSKSYKEAKMALEVGSIFYNYKTIISYDALGIGRLIYQLPAGLCKIFIREIYGETKPEEIDEEILITADKFLENNLNVSETSRQLYIHRNTLVYRIEKLEKAIGLDMRVFEDALTFKIATMVLEYLKYLEKQE